MLILIINFVAIIFYNKIKEVYAYEKLVVIFAMILNTDEDDLVLVQKYIYFDTKQQISDYIKHFKANNIFIILLK